jgi:hypothetical protein
MANERNRNLIIRPRQELTPVLSYFVMRQAAQISCRQYFYSTLHLYNEAALKSGYSGTSGCSSGR